MPVFHSFITKSWNNYKTLIDRLMLDDSVNGKKNLIYWQNKLFANAITYAVPVSLLALIPSVILEIKEGHNYVALFDFFALASVSFISLNRKMSLHLRKVVVALMIIVFAIVMMAFMGSFTMGCIYLFSLSIFISLQFSDGLAYGAVGINLFICASFALILYLKAFQLPMLFNNTTLNHWIIYSVNFLFMDLVVVALIRQLLNGLDRTMIKEAFLYKELHKEVAEKNNTNELLKESEVHYKTLFFQSPLPKWIFDVESLQFLQVNEAAINSYGYTEKEFLNMMISDLHPKDHVQELIEAIESPATSGTASSYITRHIRKDGHQIDAEVRRSDIYFKGKRARLVIATDITQQINHTKTIQIKNEKLIEIAHMQSHVVRVPLANIMGLSDLIMQIAKTDAEKELFDHLDYSVKQLDKVLKSIVTNAEDILPS
ncbi:PAS domain S-box protein [Mucilaginibacter polytrichastri]|uniref:Uncharacterized protein n=1 Tax=Mucilaginibacter polytrichastri TaxID=1302689 RepID=A0A1Q5ZTT7_9SPHI|nr:PAS domain S-box protein [Mucilaginibacter polytrichastri]OKS85189.1 hypothetical protein RG47T_0633 [Mucilaginibacter polytrichastri]SFS43005.1 PAS domain S-box-containing protein [Mucilaginibacter polytrichastri]